LFSFKGTDAMSGEMICGGDAEVLVEYVDATDRTKQEIFRRVFEVIRNREKAHFLTDVSIPVGGKGQVNHLLVEEGKEPLGGFPGDEAAIKAMPEARLLKPTQFLQAPGSDHPFLFEWLRPTGTVFIFGAGHVGECVAHLAAYVDFRVVILDDRADFASPERIPDADRVIVLDSFDRAVADLGIAEDSYVVIVTRGHAHDRSVLAQALRTPAAYIGMIGSRRKTNLIFEAMLQEGFTREDIQRVHAPIGLPIGGETPQEIGVSIISELVQIRHRRVELDTLGA
jgi:xanthine dehydrogenase accessory factor